MLFTTVFSLEENMAAYICHMWYVCVCMGVYIQ